MPNHCSNDMYVLGPLNEVLRFRDLAVKLDKQGGATINEDYIMPYPKQYKDLDEIAKTWNTKLNEEWAIAKVINPDAVWISYFKEFQKQNGDCPMDGYNMGGYQWCITNWGTKWGSYNGALPKLTEAGINSKIKLTFDTAWGPYSHEFLAKMSSLFPILEFKNKYFERGMAFQGYTIWKNGELVKEAQTTYKGNRGG